jgi:5,10-methylenetetrahydromethanopterin reductase
MGQGRPLGLVLRDLLPPAGPRDLLPVGTMVEFAALAERLGYDSVWVPEGRGRELLAALGAMGQATSRIRLATGILPLYSRPPALAAMAAATLADLTAGRFVLGIGTGHPAIIEEGYGLPYRQPLVAAREFILIVRRVLNGERVGMHGQVFRVDAFQLESRPQHRVPIYLAALGPRMLRLAAHLANGVVLNWVSPERVRAAVEVIRGEALLAGRDPSSVEVVCFVRAAVTPSHQTAWKVMRRLLATYAAMPAYARMFEDAGFVGDVAAMSAAWAAGGVEAAAAAASDEFVRGLAVVGSAQECLEGLNRYQEAGADLVAAYPFPVGDDAAASMRETIEGLGALL